MGRLNVRQVISSALHIIAVGCSAGAGALLALRAVGIITWPPLAFALIASSAFVFSIGSEIVENPKKGPKHAAR
ncbi:hypothetical protein ACJ6WD_11120 [Streptomyces sp. VTCC 41912]|uniref:hypothetical protein n=1 Tax=Streptomyces sp. VTCC 41912 TaxID=3383243 RepID=UPI0038969295